MAGNLKVTWSLQELFDGLLEQYSLSVAESYPPDRSLQLDYHADVGGLPAIAFGVVADDPVNSDVRLFGVSIKPPGTALSEADLSAECRAGVSDSYFDDSPWYPGWMTGVVAPALAEALTSLFDAPVGWSSSFRDAYDGSGVYRWDFYLGEDTIVASWLILKIPSDEPVVDDPYNPGTGLHFSWPNPSGFYAVESAGHFQNTGGSTGGGGGGDVDLSGVVAVLTEMSGKMTEQRDELQKIADRRTSLSINNGSAIHTAEPTEIIEGGEE